MELDVLPIINENDVTSVEELLPTSEGYRVNFSDNDILSALVANAIRANILVILSDVDGLYTTDPKEKGAVVIKTVEKITPELKDMLLPERRAKLVGAESKAR